jgi:hypothetical protein
MIVARLAKNKYDIEIMLDGRKIEVVDAAIEYEGKRQILVLRVSDFQLAPVSGCPERNRYERILRAFGDAGAIAQLEPVCSLIKLNAKACNGCPDRPI